MQWGEPVRRRRVLAAAGAGVVAAVLPGCTPPRPVSRLVVATGVPSGNYFLLGGALAREWQRRLTLSTPPQVVQTAGSAENLDLLASGAADVIFSQIDTAVDRLVPETDPAAPQALRALARLYDDAVHVVVPADSPARSVRDLRDASVSIGAPDSGVLGTAIRLLDAAGLRGGIDLRAIRLALPDSAAALAAGELDAFFWVGGLPTQGVSDLAARTPIRLLDLTDLVPAVRARFPGYTPGTVPARTYGSTDPVTTLLVRNLLLTRAGTPDDLAHDLVAGLFDAQDDPAVIERATLSVDPLTAISTRPILLHPGALRFYRESKRT